MPLIGRDRLDDAIDDTVKELNNKLAAIYIKGLRFIVASTPVHFKDGGRLKNNWFLTVSQPSSNTRSGNVTGSASFNEIGTMPDIVIGKQIYFTNNLPYANTVEYGGYPNPPTTGTWTGNSYQKLSAGGYSRQAPNGMVRVNIKKMESKVKKL